MTTQNWLDKMLASDDRRLFVTRHARDDCLSLHRHSHAYATLVVSGSYREISIDGPVDCLPGTVLLHPSFHAHSNSFPNSAALTVNITLPKNQFVEQGRSIWVPIPEGLEIFQQAQSLPEELLKIAEPLETAGPPPWCSELAESLKSTSTPIGSLCRNLGISPPYASRGFRRFYGVSPVSYRKEWRWRRALSLLCRGAAPVDAAAATGFADQSHLTRDCRRFTGHSPGSLRRQVTGRVERRPSLKEQIVEKG